MIAGPGGVRVGTPGDQAQFSAALKTTQESLRQLAAETGGVPVDSRAVRVGGEIKAPLQTRKINPVYTPIALAARVQGVVILEIVINEQGRVTNARILRSIPLLDQAALDAVYQWEYTPTLLNGVPVPVIMTATVQFSLNQQQ
jgi:protein TonB